MNYLSLLWLLLGLVIAQRLLELWIAQRNEQWMRKRGAIECSPEHYPWIVALHVAWLVCWPLEVVLRQSTLVAWWWTPAMLLCIAQVFRYGALFSLGRYWNTRILVIPRETYRTPGLYRWVSHPNYIAVALELACFPMLFGAWDTVVVFSLSNAYLLLGERIPAEERALALYQAPASTPASVPSPSLLEPQEDGVD